MIVFAAMVSVRKIVVGVLAVGLVLVGAAALLPKTAEADTAVSAEGAALSAKLKTNEDRVALLTACGWSVESEPVGTQEVQIPDTFDEVYEQYNAIQQAQGLDLTPYQGKRAMLYTYALTAYPTGEQGVTANLLVRRNRLIAAAVLTVLCALLVLVPFTGLEAQGKGVLIVFVWAILMWIVRPIPEYLIGVLAAAILAIFFGMKTNVVSGFSSSGWWLCLWAGFIGSAIKFSGLGERVAYWILVKMGKTELMANYATSFANTVLSLMIPSNTARGAVMSPICDNICEGMGYKRGEHKGDAAIMLSNLFTNTTNTWLFYTAVGANAIGMALVTEVTGQEISWTGWLHATFIPAGITLLLIPILCHLLFGSKKGEKREIDITFAKEKLKEMGPMSKSEKKAGLYFLLTLIAFCTNKWHHVAPDYIVFVTIFLMLCPGIGVCTFKDLNGTFAWPAFLQLGFAMSLATCVNKTGGFQWLVDAIFTTNPAFAAMNINTFLIIWLSFVVVLHVIFAGMNAMEAVMVPVSMTMASALGFDPYTMGLLTVMAISAGAFFLPFNSAPNLIFYSTDRFSTAQELKGAIPIALLIIIGLIFSVKVWFPVIGIL